MKTYTAYYLNNPSQFVFKNIPASELIASIPVNARVYGDQSKAKIGEVVYVCGDAKFAIRESNDGDLK